MHLDHLGLEDFRNYQSQALDLDPGVNLVVGRNAQGKTNLLEAIHVLGGLGSPRAADAALVRRGTDRALVHGTVTKGSRSVQIDLEIRPGKGLRALLNGSPLPRTRSLGEVIVAVFFGPDDLLVIKGSPEGRRRFIDDLALKLRPVRATIRRDWERILRQRNALLKSARAATPGSTRGTLEVWDESFARVGAALVRARLDALGALGPYAGKRYETVAGGGRLEITYSSEWLDGGWSEAAIADPAAAKEADLRRALEQALDEVRVRELERGTSLIGPQRDDLIISLTSPHAAASLDARLYASQGDQRSAALALKLGEHDVLTDTLRAPPILLLDDVFSELDPARRRYLGEAVRGMGQTVLSSAEPGGIESVHPDRVFEVRDGRAEVVGAPH
ncbi:MAG: DNA replication/repair protein RecF [Actinobacteria bacterium]|nr:DNA replication/repair protein RecF [Actinomycetota bacterium]